MIGLMKMYDERKAQWLRNQLQKIDLRLYNNDHFTLYLFHEAALAYCANLPIASILCVSSAWNSLLRTTLEKVPEGKNERMPSSEKMIKEVFKKGIITKSLHSELLQFQRGVRDQLEHSKKDHPYKGISEWYSYTKSDLKGKRLSWKTLQQEGIDLYALMNPESDTAKRGIELFLSLYQTLQERNYSNA